MTKKDYELIANVINNSELSELDRVQITKELAEEFKNTQPNFKEALFSTACVPNFDEYNWLNT